MNRISTGLLDQSKSRAQAKRDAENKRVNNSLLGLNAAKVADLEDSGGFFPGTSSTSSSLQVITELLPKLQSGISLTREESTALSVARANLARQETRTDPQGNVISLQPMDLSSLDFSALNTTPQQQPRQNIGGNISDYGVQGDLGQSSLGQQPTQVSTPAAQPSNIISPVTDPAILAQRANIAQQDTLMSTVANDWLNKGEYANVQANIGQLGTALNDLMTGKTTTGGVVGGINAIFGDTITSYIDPDFMQTKETVQEVVQQSLKAILGSQFGIKEGEQLIARAYNPSLPNAQNEVRVKRLMIKLAEAAEAKNKAVQYYQKNKTMAGYTGSLPSFADWTDPAKIDTMFGDTGEKKLTERQQKILELEQELGVGE
jgi:hypothetical protein